MILPARHLVRFFLFTAIALCLSVACASAVSDSPRPSSAGLERPTATLEPVTLAATPEFDAPIGPEKNSETAEDNVTEATPAASATPGPSPTAAPLFETYEVRAGDSLSTIAVRFKTTPEFLIKLNALKDANHILVGQNLRVPSPAAARTAPDEKLIPDSELVYGPAYAHFDVNEIAQKYGGYLASFQERVEGKMLTGTQIIQLVSERYSVGPRVLLTLLELRGGWVTRSAIGQTQITFPMGKIDPARPGLFKQASWVADQLNAGYYGKLLGTLATVSFRDGTSARLAPSLNPGTAAIQNVIAKETTWDESQSLLGPDGFSATYRQLFGDPMSFAVEPLVPDNVVAPSLRLPFEDGQTWYFTGGPHGGWASGSARAAIDLAPTEAAGTCRPSAEWAIAAAPGLVVQAENGRVVIDLDEDGFQGAGWALLYMHMATAGRVAVGTHVNTGDRIGHPSCEGGHSEADHLHFARLYNGQWISAADPRLPLALSGWTVQASADEYDGTITRGPVVHQACNCHSLVRNAILADDGLRASSGN